MISKNKFESTVNPVVACRVKLRQQSYVLDLNMDGRANPQEPVLKILDPRKFARVLEEKSVARSSDHAAAVEVRSNIGGKGTGTISINHSVSLDDFASMSGHPDLKGALAHDKGQLYYVMFEP